MADAAWLLGGRAIGASGTAAGEYTLAFDVVLVGKGSPRVEAVEVVVNFAADDTEAEMRTKRGDAIVAAGTARGYDVAANRIIGLGA